MNASRCGSHGGSTGARPTGAAVRAAMADAAQNLFGYPGSTPLPHRDSDSPDSGYTPSIASSAAATRLAPAPASGLAARGSGASLEDQLALLKNLHSAGLLQSDVFARQQDAVLTEWRRANSQSTSVFDDGASKELDSHCQRLRTALEQRMATARSRQLDYAASREAAVKLEASAGVEASAHREAIDATFREAGDALRRKERELTQEVESRRDSALRSLAAQQEELVDCLAQHSESAALLHTALREEDAHNFLAGYAQLCARLETEEAIAESLYEARTAAPQTSAWSIPDGLVPSTADAAVAAAAAIGFGPPDGSGSDLALSADAAQPDRWAPPPIMSADEAVEQEEGEGAEVQRRAAAGDVESLYTMGGWLHRGDGGVPVDRAAAAAHYRQAVAQGHAEAACALGCMLIEPFASGSPGGGDDSETGPVLEEALALLRQAADAGVLEAHYNLGWVLSGGLGDGLVSTDTQQAIEHYRVAAHGGDGLSKLSLGNLLADSTTTAAASGSEAEARERWLEAIDWWKQAMEDSEAAAEAAFRLGRACERDAEMLAAEAEAEAGAGAGAGEGGRVDDSRLVSAGMRQALAFYRQAEGAGHPGAGQEAVRLAAAAAVSDS